MMLSLAGTFSHAMPAMKYNPSGTWVYSAPDVEPGYTEGEFIIEETEEGYSVTMVFFGEYKVEAQSVEYTRKTLSFKVMAEGTEVEVSGTFKRDTFTGTASYYDGVFDFTAERKKEE
jgi:hypothetical protein